MKIVLDEGVPEGLAAFLHEHDVHSVGSLGRKGTKKGRLLQLVESVLANAFITADKNLEKQQDLIGRPFATLLLSTNYWPAMKDHVGTIREALHDAEPGVVKAVHCGTFVPRRFRNRQP